MEEMLVALQSDEKMSKGARRSGFFFTDSRRVFGWVHGMEFRQELVCFELKTPNLLHSHAHSNLQSGQEGKLNDIS